MRARGLVVPAAVIALLIAAQFLVSGIFTHMPPRIELNAVDYGITAGQGVTAGDLKQLRNRTYTFEKTVSASIGRSQVNAVVTNENYALLNEITLIRGSFFGETAAKIGQNYVVISDTLSFELFKTLDSLGLTFELDGLEYSVCGIYHRNGLLETFSGDGNETVYISSNSDFDRLYASGSAIQRVSFLSEGGSGSFAATELYADLSKITLNTRNYLINDYSSANRAVNQYVKITLFVMGVLVIIIAIEILLRDMAGQARFIRNALKMDSLGNVLSGSMPWLALRLLLCAALAFAATMIYRAIAFDLYIPGEYIPSERILDFEYYRTLITGKIQESNIYYSYKASGYERLYGFEVWLNTAFTAAGAILSVKLFINTRKLIKERLYGRDKAAKLIQEISERV